MLGSSSFVGFDAETVAGHCKMALETRTVGDVHMVAGHMDESLIAVLEAPVAAPTGDNGLALVLEPHIRYTPVGCCRMLAAHSLCSMARLVALVGKTAAVAVGFRTRGGSARAQSCSCQA